MSNLESRLKALESATPLDRIKVNVLMLCSPGDKNPYVAWIIDGPNHNTQLQRFESESREEFEARVDRAHLRPSLMDSNDE
ncbi:MAG: hypothetical protein AAFO74_02235 [Pseudomonadota bacterium]